AREKAVIVYVGQGESGDFQSNLVSVERSAVRAKYHDRLANSIGDRAQVRRLLTKHLLGALQIIDVGIDPTPADKVGLLIVDRSRGDPEPAIRSVEAAKALFCRAGFLGLPDILPPRFEFWDIVPMDNCFPLPSDQLIRGKPGVISKSLVDEIQGAIRQCGPRNRQKGVDESAEVQGSLALALTRTHRLSPATRIIPSAKVEPHAIGQSGRRLGCTA